MNDTNLKYSKLSVLQSQTTKIQKSRSIDFSDLAWFPRTPKSFARFIHSKEADTKAMIKGDSSPIKPDPRERGDSSPIKADQRGPHDRVDSSPIKTDKQELADRHHRVDSSPVKTDRVDSSPVKPDERGRDADRFAGSKGSAPALRRNSSVSAATKNGISSMRRSSSVSAERYSRMYDQSTTPIGEEDEGKKQKQRGGKGKILKACKRFLGLK